MKEAEPLLAAIRALFPPHLHHRLYLVGGTVRDLFLGEAGQDIDLLAVGEAADFAGLGFRPVTPRNAVPILFRFLPPLGKLELTVTGAGGELGADLARRDFTVNAMALSLGGELFDPLRGRDALAARRLVPCSPSAFLDDPLRLFRAFRFETAGWRMTPAAEALIREREWEMQLRPLPAERFSGELLKSLENPRPERFFQRMAALGVGRSLLPELFRMADIPAGPPQHHPEGDLLSHALQVLARVVAAGGDSTARFCAFFHDIGKLATPADRYPRHIGHEKAGPPLARELCDRLRLPAQLRRAAMAVSRLHHTANQWPELREATRIRLAAEAIKGGIAPFLPLISSADMGKAAMEGWERVCRVVAMPTAELGLSTEELAAVPPPRRGELVLQQRIEVLRSADW